MMPNPLLDIRIGTMVRANLDDPAAYGRIVRDEAGRPLGIVEHPAVRGWEVAWSLES